LQQSRDRTMDPNTPKKEQDELFAGLWRQQKHVRVKYFKLKEDSGDIASRDQAFREMNNFFIHEVDYSFSPETSIVDRSLPKGSILDAIRKSCKD
jgi:hypothetical protein